MNTIEQSAILYLNENKYQFLEKYTQSIAVNSEKNAIFTAGMSGVGKTEFATFLKEGNLNFLHIDTDNIREFFRPIGYDGQNSDIFQKVASRGYSELFNYSIKNGYSIILDSNFASVSVATQNIERLLKRDYKIDIYYLFNNLEVCFEYATRREMVTHRKVPKDVLLRSGINSYNTIIEIKKVFKEKIYLHFMDKRDDKSYENVDEKFIINKIGEYFNVK